MKNIQIMGHLVIGYPTLEESYQTAKTYIENGIEILELQIPFSDPTADGEIITLANKTAIRNQVGFSDCINFVKQLKKEYPNQEIYLMTYLNKLITQNWKDLENDLENLGISQLIIPDLPFDSSETSIFEKDGKVQLVPVIGVNIENERLEKLIQKNPRFIYIMSGFKITGSAFDLHNQMQEITSKIREKSQAKIGIGFGVNSYEDALSIAKVADVVIIGSTFIKAHQQGTLAEKIKEIKGS